MLIIDEICNCYSDQASLTVIEYISFQKFQLIFELNNKMSSSGINALFIFSLIMKFALLDMFILKSLHSTWSDFLSPTVHLILTYSYQGTVCCLVKIIVTCLNLSFFELLRGRGGSGLKFSQKTFYEMMFDPKGIFCCVLSPKNHCRIGVLAVPFPFSMPIVFTKSKSAKV